MKGRFVIQACQTGDGVRASVGDREREEGYDSRGLVWQHFRGSDTILLLDNKSDLISIVLQVLLGCESAQRAKQRGKGGEGRKCGLV